MGLLCEATVWSAEPFWGQCESLGTRVGVEPAVPGGDPEILNAQHERGGEMERVEAAEIAVKGKRGGVPDEGLVDLDARRAPPKTRCHGP